MQIWVMYGILLVNECCGTLGTTVNEAYFALFPMGAHATGMTPYKVQRDVTQKVSTQELWFLHSAFRLMFVNICM